MVEAKAAFPCNKVLRCLSRTEGRKVFRWDRIPASAAPGEACRKGCIRGTTCKRRWRWRRRPRCCSSKACALDRRRVALEAYLVSVVDYRLVAAAAVVATARLRRWRRRR